MKLSDLSAESLEKIKAVRWDRIIEKHEIFRKPGVALLRNSVPKERICSTKFFSSVRFLLICLSSD
ncbi:hypothetical protein [Nostoc sp. NMS4]|uniref:hypothetical protein n=1 Tax=Nostoc sp. NMS4 TaxID=2815390 RepID=UPI003439C91B|nr:hypothetical protein [Nostoc sp. NMS4]